MFKLFSSDRSPVAPELTKEILSKAPSRAFPAGFGLRMKVESPEPMSLERFIQTYNRGIAQAIYEYGFVKADNVVWGDTPLSYNTPVPVSKFGEPHVDGVNDQFPTPWQWTVLTLKPGVLNRDPTHLGPTEEWDESLEARLRSAPIRSIPGSAERGWKKVSQLYRMALLRKDWETASRLEQIMRQSYESLPTKLGETWTPNTALIYGTESHQWGPRTLHARLFPAHEQPGGSMMGWNY